MIILKRGCFLQVLYDLSFSMLIKTHGAAVGICSKWRCLAHVIKKDRFKLAAVVGLSTSRSEYFVRKVLRVWGSNP